MGRNTSSKQQCSSKSRVTASLLLSFLAFTNSASAISEQATVLAIPPQSPFLPQTQHNAYLDFVCLTITLGCFKMLSEGRLSVTFFIMVPTKIPTFTSDLMYRLTRTYGFLTTKMDIISNQRTVSALVLIKLIFIVSLIGGSPRLNRTSLMPASTARPFHSQHHNGTWTNSLRRIRLTRKR